MSSPTLSPNERRLLTSFLFFALAWPIFGTFMNTFLWRGSHSPILLALFNAGLYVGVPLGFAINARLLQRVRQNVLFFWGCALQGVAPMMLTLFAPSSPLVVTLLGCVFGVSLGLYWGNRNLATLRATEGKHRTAFLSMEAIQNMLAGVVAPLIIGSILGSMTGSIHLAYILLTILGFGLLLFAGSLIFRTDAPDRSTNPLRHFLSESSTLWNRLRRFEMLNGAITINESIISFLMIFSFFGLEDAVGKTKSLLALVTAIIMFRLGKRVKSQHYPVIIGVAATLLIGSATLFAVSSTTTSVIVFFASLALIAGFRTVTEMAVVYGTIDHEVQRTHADRFTFLFDREVALSVGRVGILLLFIIAYSVSPSATLRFGLLATSLLHIPLLMMVRKLR